MNVHGYDGWIDIDTSWEEPEVNCYFDQCTDIGTIQLFRRDDSSEEFHAWYYLMFCPEHAQEKLDSGEGWKLHAPPI